MQEQRYVPGVHVGRVGPEWRLALTVIAFSVLMAGIAVGVWFLVNSEPAASPTAVATEAQPWAAMDEGLIERAYVQTEPRAAMDQGLIERAYVQTEPLAALDESLIARD